MILKETLWIFNLIVVLESIYASPAVTSANSLKDEVLTSIPSYPSTTTQPLPTHPRDNPSFTQPPAPKDEKDKEFWFESGQNILKEQIAKTVNKNVAKNLIIFVGDGMSIATQMATRMYMGGEEKELSFEKFPYVGLSKTYCLNYQVADSGCTATAFLSGVKTNFGVLSMSGHVPLRNCTAEYDADNHVDTIFKFAQAAGKSTGIVTNTRITHATPAATYAKTASRYWENNAQTPAGCQDIGYQLVHGDIGKRLDVIMGGGYRELLPFNSTDSLGRQGRRTDNKDLIQEWLLSKSLPNRPGGVKKAIHLHDRDSLLGLDVNGYDNILGLFSDSHMNYHLLRDKIVEPTLTEMTQKALEMMRKNTKGYVLLIEGGRIDHAHHETKPKLAMEETVQFHKAIELVKAQVNEEDTLILVTADHSHTMTVSGYAVRGTDILTMGDFSRTDHMPYFTLSYANGPGYYDHFNESGRINPIDMNYSDANFMSPSHVPLSEETHGGDDVGVYAWGAHSHLFTGLYEQHYIAHAMMYATCLGPTEFLKTPACNDALIIKSSFIQIMIFSLIAMIFNAF